MIMITKGQVCFDAFFRLSRDMRVAFGPCIPSPCTCIVLSCIVTDNTRTDTCVLLRLRACVPFTALDKATLSCVKVLCRVHCRLGSDPPHDQSHYIPKWSSPVFATLVALISFRSNLVLDTYHVVAFCSSKFHARTSTLSYNVTASLFTLLHAHACKNTHPILPVQFKMATLLHCRSTSW